MRQMEFTTFVSLMVRRTLEHLSNVRAGHRLLFILGLISTLTLLILSVPRHQVAAVSVVNGDVSAADDERALVSAVPAVVRVAPGQIGTAEVKAECPSGCTVPITVERIDNSALRAGGGRNVTVVWRCGPVLEDLVLKNFSVHVEVTLEGGKVLAGDKIVSPSSGQPQQTFVGAEGGLFDGDKKDIKSSRYAPREMGSSLTSS